VCCLATRYPLCPDRPSPMTSTPLSVNKQHANLRLVLQYFILRKTKEPLYLHTTRQKSQRCRNVIRNSVSRSALTACRSFYPRHHIILPEQTHEVHTHMLLRVYPPVCTEDLGLLLHTQGLWWYKIFWVVRPKLCYL
jgi:hypothetical protein